MLLINEIRKIPFFRLIIPFIAGILFQINFSQQIISLFIALITSIFITGIYKYIENNNPDYHRRWLNGVLLFAVLFLSGSLLTSVKMQSDSDFSNSDLFLAKIIEPVNEKENSIKTVLEILAYQQDSIWVSCKEKIMVYFEKDSSAKFLKYGDLLLLNAHFQEVKNRGNPYEFDYKKYLAYKNIYYQAFVKSQNKKLIAENQGNIIYSIAFKLREKLLNVYRENGIEGEEFSVLAALTLGVKDFLSDELSQTYASTGAMHVLAVSGLHVGIIYLILNSLLFFMQKNKILRILKAGILIAFIWFFAFITGLSPSVRRASLMLTLIIIGQISGRHPSVYNSIAVSAFLILLVNPLTIMQVGFQLSYAAVIAIVYFQPLIYRVFEIKNRFVDKIWALTAVSIAAQIGTFPISIYYFHQFPVYFFLTNLIVIPAAYLIILLAVILLLFNSINTISAFVAFLLNAVISSMNSLTSAIEQLPFSSISYISFSFVELIILYALITLWIVYFINYRKVFIVYAGLVLLVVFFSFRSYRKIKAGLRDELVVFNSGKEQLITYKAGRKLFVFSDTSFVDKPDFKYLTANYITNNFIKELFFVTEKNMDNNYFSRKNNYFKIKDTSIVFLNNRHFTGKISPQKYQADILIISKGFNANIQNIFDLFDFKLIVLDASLKYWREKAIFRDCATENITPYSIRDKGALILNFEN